MKADEGILEKIQKLLGFGRLLYFGANRFANCRICITNHEVIGKTHFSLIF